MFHNYSSVAGGKGAELKLSVDETNKWIHQYFKDIHSPFLTNTEIKKIENDADVYVHAGDKGTKARIKRHFKKETNKS
jgi:Uri superfamily endonuclease